MKEERRLEQPRITSDVILNTAAGRIAGLGSDNSVRKVDEIPKQILTNVVSLNLETTARNNVEGRLLRLLATVEDLEVPRKTLFGWEKEVGRKQKVVDVRAVVHISAKITTEARAVDVTSLEGMAGLTSSVLPANHIGFRQATLGNGIDVAAFVCALSRIDVRVLAAISIFIEIDLIISN